MKKSLPLFIFICCFKYIISQGVPLINKNSQISPGRCSDDCEGYKICNSITGECEFKGLFPIYPLELLEILIFMIISSVATSVGVGGGAVYSSLLIFIEQLNPAEAYPISTFLIAVCSFCTFYMGAKDKERNHTASFVDYDLAMVFCPSLLLGTKIGTIFNKTFSAIFLTLFLAGFVFNNVRKTYTKAEELKKKEAEQMKLIPQDSASELKKKLLKDEIFVERNSSRKSSSYAKDIEKEIELNFAINKKKVLDEENQPIRWDRIKYLCGFLAISLIDQLLEGNSKVPSLIGIRRCSWMYWLIFLCHVDLSVYLVTYAYSVVKINYQYKLSLSEEFRNENLERLESEYSKIIFWCFLGGVVAGMLGIGGGMITTPLLLDMGLDAKSATATSNLLIVMAAVTGTIIFLFSGQLYIGTAICFAIPCGLAALYGSKAINDIVNRTKRPSILIVFLLYTLIGSFAILMIASIQRLSSAGNSNIFELNSYCS